MGRVIGVIPARSGSKGIPGKNFRELAGFPLLSWIAAGAMQSKALDEVYVSTDDPKAATLALVPSLEGRGGGPPLAILSRSTDLAQDDIPDLPVFLDVFTRLFGAKDAEDVILVHLRPTAPFVRPEEIDEVVQRLDMMAGIKFATVRSVVPARDHPQKCYIGELILGPATTMPRSNHPRQGLMPAWRAAGFVDAHRADNLRAGCLDGRIILKWEAPADRALDLDTEADWAAAERLALERGWKPGQVT